jgi:hypothetical protein
VIAFCREKSLRPNSHDGGREAATTRVRALALPAAFTDKQLPAKSRILGFRIDDQAYAVDLAELARKGCQANKRIAEER